MERTLRYADGPTAEVEVMIDAPTQLVWELISDINLPARFSTEFKGAEWVDGGPALGARFVGRNAHSALGAWETTSWVNRYEPPREFGWAVSDPDNPSATWWFVLEETDGGVRLRQGGRMGPAPSGLTIAITAMPEKEERIVARRLEEWERNMRATLNGIKAIRRAVTMTLGVGVTANPYAPQGVEFVREAERLGADSVWAPEFWAGDALTPLAYLAATTSTIRLATGIIQLGARTPAMLAMSALSLQALSTGRFILGIGTSGPRVMEGWHGVCFDRPVQRTRETIEIVRMIAAGERLAYRGEVYTLPLSAGEGRSIRSLMPPAHIPIYIAALGPANLGLTGALADGWIGNSFLPEHAHVFLDLIGDGALRAGRDVGELDLTVSVAVEFTDDVDTAARRHAEGYAFTFGAMGSATRNFYNDAFARQGFADDVAEVQRLWLTGDRDAARKRVPTEIGFGTNLIGTDDLVRGRLRLYRDAGITTLRASFVGDDLDCQLDDLGRLLGLVADVNAEVAT